MANELQKYVPFSKVDSVKQEVWGLVTAEVPDKTGETCLYAKTKPYFQAWAEEFQKATDGKSCGNLRYMHQLRVCGKGIGIEFRDADKEIWMGFKVTDSDVWKDIEEGVLTGFSQGGKYIEGPNRKGEYVAAPSEVSVVDNPCLGSAHFTHIKADGSVELRKVRSTPLQTTPVATEPLVKSEPVPNGYILPAITVEQALRAARGEDPQLTEEQIAGYQTLKALVEKSAPKTVDKPVETNTTNDKSWAPEATKALADITAAKSEVEKGMYAVSRFAELLESLSWLQRHTEAEAENEGDGSEVPGKLLEELKGLIQCFVDMAEEEAEELAMGGSGDYYYATRSEITKYLAYSAKALKKATSSSQAGTPAESDTNMQNQTGTEIKDHVLALKTAVDALAKAFETPAPAAPAAAPAPAAPVADDVNKAQGGSDLAKALETKFEALSKSLTDQLTEALSKLAPPQAAANANGKVITKSADGGADAGTQEPVNDEPVFKPQAPQNAPVSMTPELRDAFKGLVGVPL